MSKIITVLLSLYACIVFTGCATNPVTGENQFMLVSPEQELQMGAQYAPLIEKELGGRIQNARLQNYVNNVGQSVARISHLPGLRFSYIAVNDKMINAMALPGGYIFVTRGMLEKLDTEAQLAGILAHETAHVTARHSAQAMTTQIGLDMALSVATKNRSGGASQAAGLGAQLLSLNYSREHEHEADVIGMRYTIRAGYDPYAMIETMEILERESSVRPIEFLSTHPNPGNRKDNLRKIMQSQTYPAGLKIRRQDYREYVLKNLE